jgi:curved DNA-binding protein CbpA
VPDYYVVLRLGRNATSRDITAAYQRLIKESKYDTTIDRLAVETAYRVLSDIASKAQYDARETLKSKRLQGKEHGPKISVVAAIRAWFTLPHLLAILGVLLLITIGYYWFRFGYKLKDFQAGDVLYHRDTNMRFGKILRVEDHDFSAGRGKGFLIELDKSQPILGTKDRTSWFEQDTIKACCYRP